LERPFQGDFLLVYIICRKTTSLNILNFLVFKKYNRIFSERELMFTFAICHRPSVCRLSVTFVHPTQPIQIFGDVSAPVNTLVT